MPRHIRSVTARRRHTTAKRAQDAPFAAPAALVKQAELFDGLRRAFEPTPQIPETSERARDRYVRAIESLANYLEDIGADATWIERIDELAWALEDLTKGEFPPLLEPTASARQPPTVPRTSSPA
jgi:hypothetical protein